MKKFLSSDTAFKIYSVLIAIFLWVFVVYNQNPESTKVISGIHISYTNISALEDAGLVILKDDRAPTIDVSAKGRRLSLGKLDSGNITASVTVPELHVGEYDVSIDVRLPINDVSIVDKNPYTTKVVVENLKKVNIPLEIKYTGSTKDAAYAVRAEVSPQIITIRGPESVINAVSGAHVELNVADAVNAEAKKVPYRLISTDGRDITDNVNITADTDVVTLTPSVYAATEIPIKAQYTGTPAISHTISSIEATPSTIRLASKDGSPVSIDAIYTEPVDVSGISANKKLSAKLVIPDALINVLSVTEVELAINVEHTITRSFSIQNISFENAENGKQYYAEGLPLEITLCGAESAFASYIPKASVDVSSLNAGTHSLPLSLDLPDALAADNVYTIAVNVTDTAASPTPTADAE